jgi:hypothetical protein
MPSEEDLPKWVRTLKEALKNEQEKGDLNDH